MEGHKNAIGQRNRGKNVSDFFCGSDCCTTDKAKELQMSRGSAPTPYRRADDAPTLGTPYQTTSSYRRADDEPTLGTLSQTTSKIDNGCQKEEGTLAIDSDVVMGPGDEPVSNLRDVARSIDIEGESQKPFEKLSKSASLAEEAILNADVDVVTSLGDGRVNNVHDITTLIDTQGVSQVPLKKLSNSPSLTEEAILNTDVGVVTRPGDGRVNNVHSTTTPIDTQGESQMALKKLSKPGECEALAQTEDKSFAGIDCEPVEASTDRKPVADIDCKLIYQSEDLEASLGSMPPQDTISWCAICLVFIFVALPNALSVLGFSTMAWGLKVYSTLAHDEYSSYGLFSLGGSFIAAAILLVLDWMRYSLPLKIITGVVPVLLIVAGAVLKGRDYPWAPILLVIFFVPTLLGALRRTYCPTVRRRSFYSIVAAITFLAGLSLAGAWIYYVFAPPLHQWNSETKETLAQEAGDIYKRIYDKRPLIYGSDCGPNKNSTMLNALPKDEKIDIKNACANAATLWWLAWIEPIVAAACNIVLCVFCMMTGVVAKADNITEIQVTLTRFLLMLTFLLAGMYSCAVMSATSLRYGSTLMAFYIAALCVVCVWIFLELDLQLVFSAVMETKIMQQLVVVSQSDWMKALAVGALGGPTALFLVLNVLTNHLRKCRGAAGAAKNDRFTPLGRRVISTIEHWNWTSILLKIVLLGELFFTVQVGVAKATYVFLSWLNVFLSDTELLMVCIIVFIIGISMFLLPPVPGLPVYIFAGILIAEKGRKNESIGFWGGCFIASGISLFTKCLACVGQYMIGYFLGKSLKVQQLIGVDKVPTRAIEKILKSRGLSLGKVSILVGGPDWPTSVTCGIIRVNIPQMLLGTLPVVTLLVPCVFAGALMGRLSPGEDSSWRTLAQGSTAIAALVNMVASAYAVYTISQVVQEHGEELAKPRKEHEAVAALTRREQAYVDAYRKTAGWSNLCCLWKIILLTSVLCVLASNAAFVFLAELCFRPFALSSKIADSYDDDGLNGDALSIILFPVGWTALGCFAFALVLHIVFALAMRCKTRRQLTFDK